MSNFADLWNKAAKEPVKAATFDDLPEGTYMAEVVSCKLGQTKAGDKDMVSWDLRVVDGPQKNCHIWQHRPFSKTDTSDQNLKAVERAVGDFTLLGLSADTSKLADTMAGVVGKIIEVSLKNGTNGQFKNFRRIVEGAVDEPKPKPPVDDSPF